MTSNTRTDTPMVTNEDVAHPLDPLTHGEIETAAAMLREAGLLESAARIVILELHEPDKDELVELEAGVSLERRAFALLRSPETQETREVVISLSLGVVKDVVQRHGVQTAVTVGEYTACQTMLLSDAQFLEALGRRGVTDTSLVTIEAWGIGDFVLPEDAGLRLVWCPCWVRNTKTDNPYAHPLEGLYAIVDLDGMRIVRMEEHGALPMATEDGNYTPAAVGELRTDLRPLEIVQPFGPSFAVDGWKVEWQKWSLRVGFTPREGLVLHTVSYEDGGRRRPILHRASMSELYVPYGDPGPGSYRRNAFDIGEYGLGSMTNSLEQGCDCLGEIHYFDVTLTDDTGAPYTIGNAICLHEEDFGLLWKHTDVGTGHVEVRRSRRLVISSIATADNYEYGFYWYLYQDGSIECEVKLTGIVLTAGLSEGELPKYGRRIAPLLNAPNHQHFFNVRLDLDVDGRRNTVYEVHTEVGPPEDNPHGNAFQGVKTPLRTERDAQHCVDPSVARYWRIENPDRRNGHGEPVAYKLVPGGNVAPFALPGSSARRRARFVDKHVWVTPNRRGERYASGDYPNQTFEDTGLASWVEQDRDIANEDLVVWYTFGSNHLPRPEDWPVMPVERVGFMLKPDGFFDRNPALDVPASPSGHCGHDR